MEYIIAIGSACVDEYYGIDEWIPEGGKASVCKLEPVIGGMIANAASVMASMGVKTFLVDSINPAYASSRLIIDDLARYGVDLSQLIYSETAEEGKCMIFLTKDEKSLFSVRTQKEEIDYSLNPDFYTQARFIYSQFQDLLRIRNLSAFLETMEKSGTGLVLDVEKYTGNPEEKYMLENAEILFFNQFGAEDYYKASGERSFDHLLHHKANVIVVTEGGDGCSVFCRDYSIHIPAYKVAVVDTTGAGDSFNGTFLSRVCSGASYKEAAKYASAAAALCVTQYGAKSLSLNATAVDRFINRFEQGE